MGIFSFLKRQKAQRAAQSAARNGTQDTVPGATQGSAGNEAATGARSVSGSEPGSEPGIVPETIPAAVPETQTVLTGRESADRAPVDPVPDDTADSGLLGRKLARTRSRFRDNLLDFLLGNKPIDADLLEELENQLLMADVGIDATTRIMRTLNDKVARSQVADSDALRGALRDELIALLTPIEQPLEIPDSATPFVILVIGVNGSGKTTTIGKLARQLQDGGKSVMLAAGDTFRAAAVEQLQTWGERNGVPVVSQGSGADSASVIFDALQSAQARGIDVLIADTAGRLHTQAGLMDELKKVKRVLGRLDPLAPHETLIVLDGGTGQNALNQAEQFNDAMAVSGMVITKLDGTAKGGVIFSIANRLGVPIRFIGVGESVDDLEVFEAGRFVDALMALTPGEPAMRAGESSGARSVGTGQTSSASGQAV